MSKAICVLGMHRAGTSMVTGILGKCGVSLGSSSDIMGPNLEDNPAGYWENQRFVEINDEILSHFGGSWQMPPKLLPGWENDSSLQGLRQKALDLITELSKNALWGWKDPRNCLTYPFWQSLIPGLRYVVCVRDPLDVAHSLAARRFSFIPRAQSMQLWQLYYEKTLPLLNRDRCVVTRYVTFTYDARRELNRLLSALDIEADESQLEAGIASVNPDLWRNVSPYFETDRPELPTATRKLLADLHMHAGPIADEMDDAARFKEALMSLVPARTAAKTDRLEQLYIERSQENERLRLILYQLSYELNAPSSKTHSKAVEALMMEAAKSRQSGDLAGAEAMLNCAHTIDGNDARPMDQLGVVLAMQGRSAEAVAVFRRSVRLDPRNPAYRHHLARALLETNQPDDAVEQFKQLCADHPSVFAPHFEKANTLLRLNRFQEAADVYRVCLNIDPASADAMMHLGLALEGLRQFDEAVLWLKRAVQLRPTWRLASDNLAHCECLSQSTTCSTSGACLG